MMKAAGIDFQDFTFIDLGSGKGRTLLMASEFPFRRIVGVELLPELHQVAERNIAAFSSAEQKCRTLESVCCDARDFAFPPEPLLLYLFNPLPPMALKATLENLRRSLNSVPRTVRLIYHNPASEQILLEAGWLRKTGGNAQYSVFSN